MAEAGAELHTVSDTEAVVFCGDEVRHYGGLEPGCPYEFDGVSFRTLERPGGQLLAVVASVNDLHFGERRCGRMEGHDVGPVLESLPGQQPYPQVMNHAAAREIEALGPDLVVAKGDLTAEASLGEYEQFLRCYREPFAERLVATLGNHDHPAAGPVVPVDKIVLRRLEGVTVAVLDTTRPGTPGGGLDQSQLEELDELAAQEDRPVLVFGHHPVLDPSDPDGLGEMAALDAQSSRSLVELVARRPRVAGYFAGHTHRNHVRRFGPTEDVPFAEVAAVKDFPGSWAEYRIFEGGALAIHHRLEAPAALEWSQRCRALVFGLYPRYALGCLADRCYSVSFRA